MATGYGREFDANRPGDGSSSGSAATQVLDADVDGPLVVGDGAFLVGADYSRLGSDLVLTGDDGTRVVVRDYFAQAEPPALASNGGAELPADLVVRLAGPLAPGQYAQAAASETAPIGRVVSIEGSVTATRADGSRVTLEADSPMFQGDVLETGAASAIGIVFSDNTTFSLGADARMVLDELIYNPDTGAGSIALSILQGVFVFVSGEVAANNPEAMIVRTPVAIIGVRGTTAAGRAAPEGEETMISLLPDEDGTVGVISVLTSELVILNQAFQAIIATSRFLAPTLIQLSPAEANLFFADVLRVLPRSAFRPESDGDRNDGGAGDTDGGDGQTTGGGPGDGDPGDPGPPPPPPPLSPAEFLPPPPPAPPPSDPPAGGGGSSGGGGNRRTNEDFNDAPTAVLLSNDSVAENLAVNAVVGILSAADPDAGDVPTFTIVAGPGGSAAPFVIVGNELRLAAPLDFENAAGHSVTVRATDPGGLFVERTFAISVTDVNEAPTAVLLSNDSVAEDLAVNAVVGTLTATDPDAGDTATFAIVGDPDGKFVIVGNEIRLASPLDFETATSHSVTVRATDSGGLFVDRTFTIAVTDVVEVPANPLQVVSFDADGAQGLVANGFVSTDATGISFSDTDGAELNLGDFGVQGDGISLAVFLDDASKLLIDLASPATFLALDFGNDDPNPNNTSPGDMALLTVFLAGVEVGQVSVEMNRDDIMNQTISFSGATFDSATFVYADAQGTPINLIEVVDNVTVADGNQVVSMVVGTDADDLGANALTGGDGIDRISGFGGADEIAGLGGNDVLFGGQGSDILTGGAGNDRVYGGTGDDVIVGGAGDDIYDGGAGTDAVTFATSTTGVTVDLAAGTATGAETGNDTLVGVENVLGGAGNDTITGDDTANTLGGLGGDDILIGGGGNDILVGGAGNDRMDGGLGDDTIVFDLADTTAVVGGGGTDTLLVQQDAGTTLTIDATQIADGIFTGFEVVDLTNGGATTLIIGADEILSLTDGVNALTKTSDTLVVSGEKGDVLDLTSTPGFTDTGATLTIGGASYSVYADSASGASVAVQSDVTVQAPVQAQTELLFSGA